MSVLPVATYRVQFREGMTFDRAAALVPYLSRLGISHLYASPIFAAVGGSTHGYDVIDHNEIDPVIGGREGFERLQEALSAAGMGLVLDIVPNHMAASLENRWWRSVVEFGAASRFADHFDIDWRERLTLPILGRPLEEALVAGELVIKADQRNGCIALAYYDNRLPLYPGSYAILAERLGLAKLETIARLAQDVEAPSRIHDAVRTFLASEEATDLDVRLKEVSRDPGFLDRLLAAQPWQLTFWKDARRHLTYRRFFEVTGLVGVRVEDQAVFDDVHRLILSLVSEGKVAGLRVDHVDGLARPGTYLRRLREAVGPDCWLLVEKIRGENEALPAGWPDCGTTGYEFIPAMADLLAECTGLEALRADYDRFVGGSANVASEEREAKLLMLRRNFAGEVSRLAAMAQAPFGDGAQPDLREIETALIELIAGFDVYRTYGEDGGLSPADLDRLRRAEAIARRNRAASDRAIDRLVALLAPEGSFDAAAIEFRTRFQQLTGPVMAKAVEDTLFYRDNRLIALNEVGATPDAAAGDVARFHEAMDRFRHEPLGLAATATHDTKRGEDSRARLYALSEAPVRWSEAVRRWSGFNSGLRTNRDGMTVPEPAVEWLIYQMICGVWPVEGLPDEGSRDAFIGRLVPAVEKALREAKLRTDWLDHDETYEEGVLSFVRGLFAPGSQIFLGDVETTLASFMRAGAFNGLAQTLAKLTGPSVPDIYQGAERLDLSLVDPDNRRPIDFDSYGGQLARVEEAPPSALRIEDGSLKQWLIAKVLPCRARHSRLFRLGRHVPLSLEGDATAHYVAWLREHEGEAALVVVPRYTLLREESDLSSADALLSLPEQHSPLTFHNVLTGTAVEAAGQLSVMDLMGGLPVALSLTMGLP